jgi:hypothetical protein
MDAIDRLEDREAKYYNTLWNIIIALRPYLKRNETMVSISVLKYINSMANFAVNPK